MRLDGVELTWLGHAAFRFTMPDGAAIYVDPWLEGNPSCPESEQQPGRVDAIFVTHGHFDHLGTTESLARRFGAPVHGIHELAVHLEGRGVENVVGMNIGGSIATVGGVTATMVPAVHSAGISGDAGIVPGGAPAGWVFRFPEGPTVYHAGDTFVFGDMAIVAELFAPDVALLPIGGHYTMDPRQAAYAGRLLKVQTVVPMHYGTFPILAGTPEALREAAGGAFEVADLAIGEPAG